MILNEAIVSKDKAKCEYLFKAFERLTESNRYSNPPKDLQQLSNIYANTMLYVYGEDSVATETLLQFIKYSLSKFKDDNLAWCVERLLFDAS